MIPNAKNIYEKIAKDFTLHELMVKLQCSRRTIGRYAKQTNIKPKPSKMTNKTTEEWKKEFNNKFKNRLHIDGNVIRVKGHNRAVIRCERCDYQWETTINHKMNYNTGCPICDKGNHGNKYTIQEVESLLNANYAKQWSIIKYGHYSKKDSIIRCNLCGSMITVNLSDFINTTTKRCTMCQTGSFGEYVIANVLKYNNVPFIREKQICENGHQYRIDFFVQNHIGIEYSGQQHFEKGLYYNQKIIKGVKIKKRWCETNSYKFYEIRAKDSIPYILEQLELILAKTLKRPTAEFFAKNNPSIDKALSYMKTHSARQTEKDLCIPRSRLQKYVKLQGYSSISEWQSENTKQ